MATPATPKTALKLADDAIERLKIAAGVLTDEELAGELGVSRTTISRLKRGAPVNNAVLTGIVERFNGLDTTLLEVGPLTP